MNGRERPRRLGRSNDYRLGNDQVRLLDKVSSGGRRPNFFRAAISLLNAYVLWRTRCARDERFVTRTAHLVAAKDRLLADYRKWEGPDPTGKDQSRTGTIQLESGREAAASR